MTFRLRITHLAALLALLALSGCGGTSGSNRNTVPYSLPALAGNWIGVWRNTTDGTSGTANLVITEDAMTGTASVVVTMTGSVFGGTAPAPQTLTGTMNTGAGSVNFNGNTPAFGTYALNVNPVGTVSGTLTSVSSVVTSVAISGVANGSNINLTFVENLSGQQGGSSSAGSVTFTHT